jgi:hypothetical protein
VSEFHYVRTTGVDGGVDAVNVGPLDLAYGLDYLQKLQRRSAFPWLSTNLVGADAQFLDGEIVKDGLPETKPKCHEQIVDGDDDKSGADTTQCTPPRR